MPSLDARESLRSLPPVAGQRRQYVTAAEAQDNVLHSPRLQPCRDWFGVRMISRGKWTDIVRARPIQAAANHPADYVLKIVTADGPAREVARQGLQREATIARQMSHPRLAVVLTSHLEAPPYYLVFPHLDGKTVDQVVHLLGTKPRTVTGQIASLPLGQSLWIVRQTAEALAALHQGGWLHGDVSPANIMVGRCGEVTLFDFGLARRLRTMECRAAGTWSGTVRYAAPETFLAHGELTAAADTYSLGLILFELLTSTYAWQDVPAAEIPAAHLTRPLPDIRSYRRDLPGSLARLIQSMTAKEPLRRPDDEELVDRLIRQELASFLER